MNTIYTKQLKQKLFDARIIDWHCKLDRRPTPKHGDDVIDVWWEWNGATRSQYDLLWFVGRVDHVDMMGIDTDNAIDGGYKSLAFGKHTMKLFKAARKLELDLKRKYPEYQLT